MNYKSILIDMESYQIKILINPYLKIKIMKKNKAVTVLSSLRVSSAVKPLPVL